jgi:2-keto-4-pentenoate hydratase
MHYNASNVQSLARWWSAGYGMTALKPGDIVMSGAISKLVRPKPGDTIGARYARLGSINVKVVA